MRCNDIQNALDFAPPRFGSRSGQNGNLVDDDNDVLDEDRVGMVVERVQLEDRDAQFLHGSDVTAVLLRRCLVADRLAIHVSELTFMDGFADWAGDGDQHVRHGISTSQTRYPTHPR